MEIGLGLGVFLINIRIGGGGLCVAVLIFCVFDRLCIMRNFAALMSGGIRRSWHATVVRSGGPCVNVLIFRVFDRLWNEKLHCPMPDLSRM